MTALLQTLMPAVSQSTHVHHLSRSSCRRIIQRVGFTSRFTLLSLPSNFTLASTLTYRLWETCQQEPLARASVLSPVDMLTLSTFLSISP